MKLIRKRLTYANVMSSIAVFLVLGGGAAYAAQKIGSNEIKGNSITTGKIKKEAVTASKIKNNSVTTAKIEDNAVTTAKIGNGAVTGAKLNLGTVGTVPNAAHAITADSANSANNANTVGGLSVKKFSVKVPSGAGETNILSVGGITLTGSCVGGATSLTATKDTGAPSMTATMAAFNTAASELKTAGFSSFTTIDLDQGLSTLGGKLETTTSAGNVTTIQYQARDAGNFTPNENVCVYAGSAISG